MTGHYSGQGHLSNPQADITGFMLLSWDCSLKLPGLQFIVPDRMSLSPPLNSNFKFFSPLVGTEHKKLYIFQLVSMTCLLPVLLSPGRDLHVLQFQITNSLIVSCTLILNQPNTAFIHHFYACHDETLALSLCISLSYPLDSVDEKCGFSGLGSAPLLPFQLLNSIKVTVAWDGFSSIPSILDRNEFALQDCFS